MSSKASEKKIFLHDALLQIVWRHWQEQLLMVEYEMDRAPRGGQLHELLGTENMLLRRAEGRFLQCEMILAEMLDLYTEHGIPIPRNVPPVRDVEDCLLGEAPEEGQ